MSAKLEKENCIKVADVCQSMSSNLGLRIYMFVDLLLVQVGGDRCAC